jgi:hypothetical protein
MSCCFVGEFCAARAVTSRLVPCSATELGSKKVAKCSSFVRLNASYAPFEFWAKGMALTSARSWHLSSQASAERPSAAGRKPSQRSTPHPVFPAGGCTTCAGPSPQGSAPRRAPRSHEAVLNHLSGSRAGVVGIYQRHDWAEEKRAALDAWSAQLLTAAESRLPAGKVLPFSRARSGEM